jgi:hypothetical protein
MYPKQQKRGNGLTHVAQIKTYEELHLHSPIRLYGVVFNYAQEKRCLRPTTICCSGLYTCF